MERKEKIYNKSLLKDQGSTTIAENSRIFYMEFEFIYLLLIMNSCTVESESPWNLLSRCTSLHLWVRKIIECNENTPYIRRPYYLSFIHCKNKLSTMREPSNDDSLPFII